MIRKKPNDELASLAENTALVVATVDARNLCSYSAGRGARSWHSGLVYDKVRAYPFPPLRPHPEHAPSWLGDCADCHIYTIWRAAYVDRATQSGDNVLPEMVAPHGLPETATARLNPFHMTGHDWLDLVATMIEAAQPRGTVTA